MASFTASALVATDGYLYRTQCRGCRGVGERGSKGERWEGRSNVMREDGELRDERERGEMRWSAREG